ncbi:histidine phosphatase family protein [Bacillus cytotoxicus]|uniref:Phosphoglycerate mutase n=2 Tax=Bacillus cytotoxicus TaxID=580165 RepID=A0AAX2CJA3_9BACI|nr:MULTISPECIES: histidine phosphatase family protein [Bacillus cereus group]ABS22871.1 Phosphoglycerate mutase [Bacillus cytotoxicus NVH 391-98]AWC29525.1 histidine phosphatase family protein [Bacillus cytotoxicus]AWC33538.1 histidine phosphatase family protein [Bacillus cytotoxicus]AWC37515.1 histidine phosphatase family protein [Bacillus cytotoxicus]AWC41656.1 histidine phosphatase family protein [Bacillus cytotoxicus]
MTEICLVRHGQTDWNFQEIIQGREDIPLNEVGKKQASQSAAALQLETWDVIISSPLIRAQETAQAIGEAVGIHSIILDERFVERNFGEASGKPVATVREQIAIGNVEGMETDEEIVNRCFTALQDVAKKHAGKRIIIVAHSHAIKAILHAILPEEITFKTPLKNACINYVKEDQGKWEVLKYNIAEHICV